MRKKKDNEVESLSWNVNFEEATTDAARCGVWRIFVFEKIPVIVGRWRFYISIWMSEALVVEVALCVNAEGA